MFGETFLDFSAAADNPTQARRRNAQLTVACKRAAGRTSGHCRGCEKLGLAVPCGAHSHIAVEKIVKQITFSQTVFRVSHPPVVQALQTLNSTSQL